MSDRWGGYAASSRAVDAVHNPIVMPVALGVWLISALLLIVGQWTVVAALANLVLARYFGIFMRWRGVLRGMGAPGFMTYWLAVAVFLLELTTHHAPSLRSLALFALQLDLGFIFLAAALYKLRSGYPQNHGMEFGLTNPQWGYWWRWYKRLPPKHPLFRVLNHLAMGDGARRRPAMLFPPTRFIGGLILSGRSRSSRRRFGSRFYARWSCSPVCSSSRRTRSADGYSNRCLPVASVEPTACYPARAPGVAVLIVAYIALLPLAYGGSYSTSISAAGFPRALQRALDPYTNLFGIISGVSFLPTW